MTRIDHFQITGLAGRPDRVEFALHPDVNVFWGLNGCGKTSLLRVLHAALDNDAAAVRPTPVKRAAVTYYSHMHDASATRVFDRSVVVREEVLIDTDDGDFVTAEIDAAPNWLTKSRLKKLHNIQMQHGYLPTSRLWHAPRKYSARERQGISNENAFDAAFADRISTLWLQYFAAASDTIQNEHQAGLAQILDLAIHGPAGRETRFSQMDEEEAYLQVRDYFLSQQMPRPVNRRRFAERYTTREGRELVARISEINRRVNEASAPHRRLFGLVEDMFGGTKSIEPSAGQMRIRQGKKFIELSDLSSGEKQLMLILLECMSQGPSTVIIDEPELSMHVDWQQRLIESIRTINPECQLILATHSPEVMALVPDEKIFEL